MTAQTNFYTFEQNNSGGYFVIDPIHGVCEFVIIEATSAQKAFDKLLQIGEYVQGFDSWCACCGERWSSFIDEKEGFAEPSVFGRPIYTVPKSRFNERVYIHHIDGTITEYIFK